MRKDYFALWSILALSFVLFLLLSTCDNISVAGITLKPSKMADCLFPRSDADLDPALMAEADSVAALDLPPLVPEEPDTLPKTLLFIGDSMLEGLSPRLSAYCDASGHTLYTVIWYSSTSEIWGECDLLKDYIDKINPDYVLVCLGANELFVRDIAQKRDKYVKSILSQIGDLPYLWIGPPNWKDDTGINDLVAANARKGCFFLTNGMKFDRKKDGAHPTPASAITWMDSVVRWMPANAAYPLRLETPEKKTSKPARVFVHQPGRLK